MHLVERGIVPRRPGRFVYVLCTVAVIGLGLASRRIPGLFPAALGKYPGDALWALMVFCALGAAFPHAGTVRLGFWALAISFLDEFSQMYHRPWIDAIRSTTLGHLVLGSEFGWGDLLAYLVGVGFGMTVRSVAHAQRSVQT